MYFYKRNTRKIQEDTRTLQEEQVKTRTMIEEHKLDPSFGPVGATAGRIIFIAGILLSWFYLSAVVLIVLGAFAGFSNSSAIIDFDRRRVRFSNNLFGLIRTGKWIAIEPSMTLRARESKQSYRAFSQGNRPLDVPQDDFRVLLCGTGQKEIMTIGKWDNPVAAREACHRIATGLGLAEARLWL